MGYDVHILMLAGALAKAGVRHVCVTVTATKGSTPRNAGAKMLVGIGAAPDLAEIDEGILGDAGCAGGTGGAGSISVPEPGVWVVGTVGGGQFEQLAIDEAMMHLRARTCGAQKFTLGADADQCCGGVVELYYDYVGYDQRIIIFGAGHVSFELARLLMPAGHEVTIVDDRPQWNSDARFPLACARREGSWEKGVALAHREPAQTLVCILTYSHDTDFDLLRSLLTTPPAFVGLIGSKSKRACLLGRLVATGIAPEVVSLVECPVGVGDCGKEPALVAISIAARLLLAAKQMQMNARINPVQTVTPMA
jgi:xanthine dehydrogenase accessory factor